MERCWEYQRYAAECVLLAEQISNPEQKPRLLAMAQAWLRLAQLAEKNNQNDITYETPRRRNVASAVSSQAAESIQQSTD